MFKSSHFSYAFRNLGKSSKKFAIALCSVSFSYIRLLLGCSYCCRYNITCSAYARHQFSTQPFFKALKKTCYRVLRCNPFSKLSEEEMKELHS